MASRSPFRVALISMPWAIFNRPSIQLGCLQSFLETHGDFQVDSLHPYLHIAQLTGTDKYREIAHSGWAGEALFSPLLFPEKSADARQLYQKSLSRAASTGSRGREFDRISGRIEEFCTTWLTTLTSKDYDLFGFSVCFNQLLPSLYMAGLIKKQLPSRPIVFGGSSCCDELGQSLVHNFTEVDYVVDGEGEQSLLALCNFLSGKGSHLPSTVYLRGVTSASATTDTPATIVTSAPSPLDLNDLPVPSYHDYFTQMRQLFTGQPFIPTLPLEFSRGCWWNKCAFCNLNIQWPGYRTKSGARMVSETLELVKRHESLHFTFTDNALAPREADYFFQEIGGLHMDLDFFAEIRALTGASQLQLYRNGGLSTVQVGIEALSTPLLKKMAKGTSTIENIAAMKICSQNHIRMEGNLITEFPSSSEDERDETLTNLDYLLPFAPLDTASFFLGYGSPVYRSGKDFGLKAITPHHKNRKLFPDDLISSMTLLVNGYRGDKRKQERLWRPVHQKVREWKEFHGRRTSREHPLSYRDGQSFLIIRQEAISGPVLHHRLRGLSRKIYLACEEVVDYASLLHAFPGLKEPQLAKFIADMCKKRLMFQERGRVLSLAIGKGPGAFLSGS